MQFLGHLWSIAAVRLLSSHMLLPARLASTPVLSGSSSLHIALHQPLLFPPCKVLMVAMAVDGLATLPVPR